MPSPGEVPQEIGRAYVFVLTGALQAAIGQFRAHFTVLRNPTKLTFGANISDSAFSFDVRGHMGGTLPADVYIECKGRAEGSDLSAEFREFVIKSYALSTFPEHSRDRFWFVTNVPFSCGLGRSMVSRDFIGGTVAEAFANQHPLTRGLTLDPDVVESLSGRLTAAILTDTFMRSMGLVHYVEEGDSMWTITQQLYGSHLPDELTESYEPYAMAVAHMNQLKDPSLIYPGERLKLPWFGLNW